MNPNNIYVYHLYKRYQINLEIKTSNFDLIKEQCDSKNNNNQRVLFKRVIRMCGLELRIRYKL